MKPTDRRRLVARLRWTRCPRCRDRHLAHHRSRDAVVCQACSAEYPVERFARAPLSHLPRTTWLYPDKGAPLPRLATRTTVPAKPLPEGWVRTAEVRLPGLAPLTAGVEVTIRGERGRWVFLHHTTAPKGSWIDVYGGPYAQRRSFDPSRIRTVHRVKKLR